MNPALNATLCADCSVDVLPGHWYVVEDTVWAAAMAAGGAAGRARRPRAEFLCLDCLEHRLGRRLDVADLIACPANAPGWSLDSPRLFELKKKAYALHGDAMFPPAMRRLFAMVEERISQQHAPEIRA